jgi:SnoaL-like domain
MGSDSFTVHDETRDQAMVSRRHLRDWLSAYERAWRTPGTGTLGELFDPEASYQLSPYEEPLTGLDAIAAMWEDEREGPDEVFTMDSEIVAAEGDTAVVRVEVRYGEPVTREYRDLWVIRFTSAGTCSSFEEWPFWPGQGHVAPDAT